MGGSASYRLARKIANAQANGESQEVIDELERQRQATKEIERTKRESKKAESEVIIPEGGNVSVRNSVSARFEALDEERGLRFPKIDTDMPISVRPSYPITDRQLSYRQILSDSQRKTLDAMERRLQTGRYTQNEFKDEIVDIAKSLGMNTNGMSAWTLSVGINDLLGARL